MSVISVVAKIKVKEGRMDEFMDLVSELMEGVAEEEGCLLYTANTVKEDPNLVVFMERYRDKEALGVHGQTPHFTEFFSKAGELLDGPPEMTIMREAASI
jgi:quinol monooxygenase YgiN